MTLGGAGGGPGRNGGDPFAKILKAFHDVGMERFSRDEGPWRPSNGSSMLRVWFLDWIQ